MASDKKVEKDQYVKILNEIRSELEDFRNRSSDGSLTTSQESTTSDSSPLSFADFKQRLGTFNIINWSTQPVELSPLICAAHGWQVKEKDVLKCKFCLQFCHMILPKKSQELYEKKKNELVDKLKSSHRDCCLWRKVSCPDFFFTNEGPENPTLESQIVDAAKVLTEQKSLFTGFQTSQNFTGTEDALSNFCLQYKLDPLALLIASNGWKLRSLTRDKILTCDICNRKLPLWTTADSSQDKPLDLDKHMAWCPWRLSINGCEPLKTRVVAIIENHLSRKRKRDSLESQTSQHRKEEVKQICRQFHLSTSSLQSPA